MKMRMESGKKTVKELISTARRFVIGLDIWSNKGLTASFLGISAAFFHPPTRMPLHVFINLYQIPHPHTGSMIANKLLECLMEWSIESKKVLMLVTDNGSNMIKAVNDLSVLSRHVPSTANGVSDSDTAGNTEDSSESEPEDTESEAEDDASNSMDGGTIEEYESESELSEDGEQVEVNVNLRRFPCIAHTLQLVVKTISKHDATARLILKTTKIAQAVRKSSVATQKLVEKCGKTLVKCNATRWNSTLFMIQRLVEVRQPLNDVLDDLRMDGLLASEWSRLEELYKLLKPVQCHTDVLQSDTMVLSNVIPALIDLSCHFEESENPRALAIPLLKSLRQRFATIFDSRDPEFDAIAAAACFLDPTVAVTIMTHSRYRTTVEGSTAVHTTDTCSRGF